MGCRDARQVGSTRRRCQGQSQSDEIVGRISDDGLVEVANLDGYPTVSRSDRTEVASVAIATYPDRRPLGQGATLLGFEPFVEVYGASSHVSLGRTRHLECLLTSQGGDAVGRPEGFF